MNLDVKSYNIQNCRWCVDDLARDDGVCPGNEALLDVAAIVSGPFQHVDTGVGLCEVLPQPRQLVLECLSLFGGADQLRGNVGFLSFFRRNPLFVRYLTLLDVSRGNVQHALKLGDPVPGHVQILPVGLE